jgi:hypothetical protein
MNAPVKKDLLVLVADRNMEAAVAGLLGRPEALGIRSLQVDIRRHPQKDSGCCLAGVKFLQAFASQYLHGLLMFDHAGSSRESESPDAIEADLARQLGKTPWDQRAAVIVVAPELEAWVWSDSPHVETELGWIGRQPNLREWLMARDFLEAGQAKPVRPKEAMEAVLWETRKPRSSAIYQALAEKVSLRTCSDRAFGKLKSVLQGWFA